MNQLDVATDERVGSIIRNAIEQMTMTKVEVMRQRDAAVAENKELKESLRKLTEENAGLQNACEKMVVTEDAQKVVLHALDAPQQLWVAALRAQPKSRAELRKLLEVMDRAPAVSEVPPPPPEDSPKKHPTK